MGSPLALPGSLAARLSAGVGRSRMARLRPVTFILRQACPGLWGWQGHRREAAPRTRACVQSLLTSPRLREVLGERLQSSGMEQDWDLGLQVVVPQPTTGVHAPPCRTRVRPV